jgi:hypothetical protein
VQNLDSALWGIAQNHVFALCGVEQHQNGISLKNVILNHMAKRNTLTKNCSQVEMPTYGLRVILNHMAKRNNQTKIVHR